MKIDRLIRIFSLFVPPIFEKIAFKIYERKLPELDDGFKDLILSGHALQKLIKDYKFTTVLDVGSGAGDHARIFKNNSKKVTALDFGKSIYALKKGLNYQNIKQIEEDFYEYNTNQKFDCLWASHVLEHQQILVFL